MNDVNATQSRYRCLYLMMLMWVVAGSAFATDPAPGTTDRPPSDTVTNGRTQLQLQQRFIREFSGFAGSAENAKSLYGGLRNGSRIMLTRQTVNSNGVSGTSVLQFNPAGLPMGTGSAFISAALARQQLANHGITSPAPQQIQAAMNGGPVRSADPGARPVVLKGVLTQRSEGLGWSVIAKASGISLGRVIGDMRHTLTDTVALGGDKAFPPARSAGRSSRHAVFGEVPSAMPASARMPARNDGLIAQ